MNKTKRLMAIVLIIAMVGTLNAGFSFAAEVSPTFKANSMQEARQIMQEQMSIASENLQYDYYKAIKEKEPSLNDERVLEKLWDLHRQDCYNKLSAIYTVEIQKINALDYSTGNLPVDITENVNALRNAVKQVADTLRDDQIALAEMLQDKYEQLEAIDLSEYQKELGFSGSLYYGRNYKYYSKIKTQTIAKKWINESIYLLNSVEISNNSSLNEKRAAEVDGLYKPASDSNLEPSGVLYTGEKFSFNMWGNMRFSFSGDSSPEYKGLKNLPKGNVIEVAAGYGINYNEIFGTYDIDTKTFTVDPKTEGYIDRRPSVVGAEIEKLVLGKSVVNEWKNCEPDFDAVTFKRYFPKLREIEVSPENKDFSSEDGILYDKAKTKVLLCPNHRNYVTSVDGGINVSAASSVTLPETVTTIGKYAFKSCRAVEEITNLDQVKNIEDCAFDSSGLKKAKLNQNIRTINYGAFANCLNLREINFNHVESIGGWAFDDCWSLNKVDLSNVSEIGENTFSNCLRLSDIEFSDELRTIGYGAFMNNRFMTLTIPKSVYKIDPYAFEGCTDLEKVVFEEGSKLHELSDCIFAECDILSEINLPENLSRIGNRVFSALAGDGAGDDGGCNLKEIVIPDSVTSIGDGAFSQNIRLEKVKMPKNLKVIGSETFWGCTSLSNLEIPKAVKTFDETTFGGCDKLTLGVYKDTEGHKKAEEYGLKYKLLDGGSTGGGESGGGSTDGDNTGGDSGNTGGGSIGGGSTGSGTGGGYLPPVSDTKPVISEGEGYSTFIGDNGKTVLIVVDEGYELVDVTLNGVSKGKVTKIKNLKTSDRIVVTVNKQTAPVAPSDNERLINGVQNTKIWITKTSSGKGWIKLNYKKSKGFKVDYYEVFRKAGKNSKFGEKAFYKTNKNSSTGWYKNTKSLKKGTRYYYKVRGVRIIDGKKYYTQWSKTYYRIAK